MYNYHFILFFFSDVRNIWLWFVSVLEAESHCVTQAGLEVSRAHVPLKLCVFPPELTRLAASAPNSVCSQVRLRRESYGGKVTADTFAPLLALVHFLTCRNSISSPLHVSSCTLPCV